METEIKLYVCNLTFVHIQIIPMNADNFPNPYENETQI